MLWYVWQQLRKSFTTSTRFGSIWNHHQHRFCFFFFFYISFWWEILTRKTWAEWLVTLFVEQIWRNNEIVYFGFTQSYIDMVQWAVVWHSYRNLSSVSWVSFPFWSGPRNKENKGRLQYKATSWNTFPLFIKGFFLGQFFMSW